MKIMLIQPIKKPKRIDIVQHKEWLSSLITYFFIIIH